MLKGIRCVDEDTVVAQGDGITITQRKGTYYVNVMKGAQLNLSLCSLMHKEMHKHIRLNVNVEQHASLVVYSACSALKADTHLSEWTITLHEHATLELRKFHVWKDIREVRSSLTLTMAAHSHFIQRMSIPHSAVHEIDTLNAELQDKAHLEVINTYDVKSGRTLETHTTVTLNGRSSARLISKAVVEGAVSVYDTLVGRDNSKGHIECHALIKPGGTYITKPALQAESPDAELSHEAGIGKINEQQLLYLRSKGLTEEQAQALITRAWRYV